MDAGSAGSISDLAASTSLLDVSCTDRDVGNDPSVPMIYAFSSSRAYPASSIRRSPSG